MSNTCADYIFCNFKAGCSCVKYNPVTGQLAIDGELVKLYMQATSVATAESLQGSVLNPAIAVGASAITGLCAEVADCMTSLPPGSIDPSALKPGAPGTVLQTLGGKATWAGLDDSAIQKAFGDNTPPVPPIDGNELAKVYGEDSSQKLTSVPPQGVYEAGVANMPLISPTAPLKQISGVDAGGMAVKANIIRNGIETKGEIATFPPTVIALTANVEMVKVKAPSAGLYAVSIFAVLYRTLGAALPARDNVLLQNLTSSYLVIAPGALLYHSGSDYEVQIAQEHNWPVGADLGQAVRVGQVATVWLEAGAEVVLSVYNTSVNGAPISFKSDSPVSITLTALGPMQIAGV